MVARVAGMDVLTVAAVCFRDQTGRVLTVRKRGTDAFMLPGGKLEPGRPRSTARFARSTRSSASR
ncbi:hypothetical protein [Tsukamurella sp. PLM1]|uniref:hypothetical protein n=1 Tax=Tsukamurella sp. PLM1 TaxID=2929795 RepID=UPI00205D621D|nr:hypothetical protein [Tsukamurella sp. PLM1]BDH55285.1 hypothetical protein MTP03_02240 [Tsukamurella sp. PLM1]